MGTDLTAPVRRTVRGRTETNGQWAGIYADLADQGIEFNIEVTIERQPAPVAVAKAFGVDAGVELVVRHRRQSGNGKPIQLASTWFLPAVVDAIPQLTQHDTGSGGFLARMKENGHPNLGNTSTVKARIATDDEAERLELGVERAVLDEVWTVVDQQSGDALAVTVAIGAGERNEHTFVY